MPIHSDLLGLRKRFAVQMASATLKTMSGGWCFPHRRELSIARSSFLLTVGALRSTRELIGGEVKTVFVFRVFKRPTVLSNAMPCLALARG